METGQLFQFTVLILSLCLAIIIKLVPKPMKRSKALAKLGSLRTPIFNKSTQSKDVRENSNREAPDIPSPGADDGMSTTRIANPTRIASSTSIARPTM